MLAVIIYWLHCLIVFAIIATPFLTSNERYLTWYILFVLLVMIQWLLNNNKCCLSQLESWAKGGSGDSRFLTFLPAGTTWLIMIFLLGLALYKLPSYDTFNSYYLKLSSKNYLNA